MSERKHRLVDCNPRFAQMGNRGDTRYLTFDCPEGHEGCRISVPFTPDLSGSAVDGAGHPVWSRSGEDFSSLSLSPSIRINPVYHGREEALSRGAAPEHLHDIHFCALHIFIANGAIEFCGDSK